MSGALEVMGGLVLDNGKKWGRQATSWQWDDARAVLDPDHPQKWHWLGRPKGGSKSTDLAGMAIAWLLTQARPMDVGYAVAADEEQARRLLDRMRGFAVRTPGLARLLVLGQHRITAPNGASVVSVAADPFGNEGWTTPFVMVDELSNWPATPAATKMWELVISSMPKVAGARLVVICHAGDPVHFSYRHLATAKARPDSWHVHIVPGPLEWMSAAHVEDMRAQLPDSIFAHRVLNRWAEAQDRLVSAELLEAAAVLDGPQPRIPAMRHVIGLDIGLRFDKTAVAVCHSERDRERPDRRRIVVDNLTVMSGTKAKEVNLTSLEETIAALSGHYNAAPVFADPWQGIAVCQRLRARGIAVAERSFSPKLYSEMAHAMYGLLHDRLISIPRYQPLLDELATVRLVESGPGTIRVQHDPGKHDDMTVAIGFAVVELLGTGGWVYREPFAAGRRLLGERPITAGVRDQCF